MRTPAPFESPKGLWRVFAGLDRLDPANRAAWLAVAIAATWGLLRGTLMLLGDDPSRMDQHLGGLLAILVLTVGLLHRHWYQIERPRWWIRVRASMVDASSADPDDSGTPRH